MGIDIADFKAMQERLERNRRVQQKVEPAHDKANSETPSSKPQLHAGDESLETDKSKAPDSGCCALRVKTVAIVSYRRKLLDKDNLYGGVKWWVDALRYCGFISDDSSKEIELEVTQKKVSKKTDERTEITIID